MTATAFGSQHHFIAHRLFVTSIAVICTFFMRPIQLEIGLVVIEIPGSPVTRVVASLALGTQLAFMHILLLVTCPAVRLDVLELRRVCMTLFALNQHMAAKQGICRHPVRSRQEDQISVIGQA